MKMFNFCAGCGRALSRSSGYCPPCDHMRRNRPLPQQQEQDNKKQR